MKKLLLSLALILLLVFSVGCSTQPTKTTQIEKEELSGSIKMDGSTTVYPVAKKAAEVFTQNNPKVSIDVKQSSTGEGLVMFLKKEITIADGTRAPKDAEIAEAQKNGMDIFMTVIANDAVAVHVNVNNPVDDLTKEQIKGIFFDGTITDWSQLTDKKSGPINIYTTDPAVSGTAELFNTVISGKATTAYVSKANEKLTSELGYPGKDGKLWVHPTPNMITVMEKDENGIGFIPINWIQENQKSGNPTVKALKIKGIYPTKETVLDTSYPLARKMIMMTNGEPKGVEREYINFVLSQEGQKIVEEEGFISIN